MAPIRKGDAQPDEASPLTKYKNRPTNRHKERHQHKPGKESATPGISKIKSSLRQTRRLLAKDKLAADVRVETERRLKALEAELVQAELANKERSMAMRYHKVKFFERQKVTRKIAQIKKELGSENKGSTQKKLLKTLNKLRVDLNYILHYPKLKKYVSLFPPEVRQGSAASKVSEADAAETTRAREEVRDWIRSCMENGQLSKEPELQEALKLHPKLKSKEWGGNGEAKQSEKLKGNPQSSQEEHMDTVKQDDFFGEDEEEDS